MVQDLIMKEEDNSGGRVQSQDFIVRVRGLPWSCTDGELRNFFSGITISEVHFTFSKSGRPSGEAYLVFTDDNNCKAALAKDKKQMGHRYLDVFHAKPAEMNYVLEQYGAPNYAKERICRLRGLAFETTAEDIKEFFDGVQVEQGGVLILQDEQGRCSGEAYVQFTTPDQAELAHQKHMQHMGRRYVEVFRSSEQEMKFAKRKNEQQIEPPSSLFGPMMGGPPGGGGRRGMMRPSPYGMGGIPSRGGAGRGMMRPPPMGGMGMMGRCDERPPPRRNGAPPSLFDSMNNGYSDYTSFEDAPSGGKMGMKVINGRRPGLYATSDMDQSAHYVHMRGLPYKVSEPEIGRFFLPLQIRAVHMLFEESSGRPAGEATVEFNTHDDAQNAMKKHKESIGSRYIELFLNSTPGNPKTGQSQSNTGSLFQSTVKREVEKYQAPATVQYPGQERYASLVTAGEQPQATYSAPPQAYGSSSGGGIGSLAQSLVPPPPPTGFQQFMGQSTMQSGASNWYSGYPGYQAQAAYPGYANYYNQHAGYQSF